MNRKKALPIASCYIRKMMNRVIRNHRLLQKALLQNQRAVRL